eukprot:13093356-Alexandrium_andersonii.AAC.1
MLANRRVQGFVVEEVAGLLGKMPDSDQRWIDVRCTKAQLEGFFTCVLKVNSSTWGPVAAGEDLPRAWRRASPCA